MLLVQPQKTSGSDNNKIILTLIITTFPLLFANLTNQFTLEISNILFSLLPLSVVFFSVKKLKDEKNDRKPLFTFFIFSTTAAIAEIIWIIYETVLKIDLFPSVADFFYMISYVTLFIFLLPYARQNRKVLSRQTILSGLLSIGFLIPVSLTAYNLNVDSEPLQLGVSLAYPITDVLLLFLTITCVLSMRGTADRFLILLIAGIASFIISDILYLTVYDTYENGNIIDIGWIFGYIFFAFAIIKFDAGSMKTKPESISIRYEMIPKFVIPFAIFAGFAIILSYAANLYPVIQDAHGKDLVEGIMYIAFAIMMVLAVMAFFINKNTDQLVKKITRQLEIEHNALKAKNEENNLLLQKLENQNLKLKKIDRLKDEFSSMITHELKTPLAPILSWSGVLKSQKDFDKDSTRVKAIQKIESNALKLSQLISDILDAEKLELSKMPFHKKEFSVSDLVVDIYENYKNMMEKQSTSFNVSCDPKIVLISDIDRIEQVLKNFINNSMDFVPKLDGKISLKVEQHDDKISFYVIDNGIGISKENQQNLFKKFYQIDNSITRRHGGSGLGLSICKEIVENLGGEIGIQSELGKGSTFYFILPVTHHSNNDVE